MSFYMYSQNNSGGSLDVDDRVAHYVIVEADDPGDADRRAEAVGLYFDGCDKGIDCKYCGDRWHRTYADEGEPQPVVYGKPVETEVGPEATGPAPATKGWGTGRDRAYVYYRDGSKKRFGA